VFHNTRGLLSGKRSTRVQLVGPDGGPWPMQSDVFEHVTTDHTNAGRECGNSEDLSVLAIVYLYGRQFHGLWNKNGEGRQNVTGVFHLLLRY